MQLPRPRFIPPLGPGRRSARQRVLADWRGTDLQPLESAQKLTARPAGAVLPRLVKELRLDRRRSDAEIVKVWNSVLHPLVVAHAQPVGLNKGTLYVQVDSSVWMSEIIRYHRKEILERLQHSFGKDLIAKLSFKVG
jgi:hypothetical protein